MNIHNYVIQKVQIAILKLIVIFNDSTYVTIIMYYNKNTSTSWILQLGLKSYITIQMYSNWNEFAETFGIKIHMHAADATIKQT